MPRIYPVILFCLLLHTLPAQTYPGTWNGAGYYDPGQGMTTVMQKMGGKKLISININASNNITGSMLVTYDKSKATIVNNGGNQAFIIAGKLDVTRKLLLLILTHTKMGVIEAAFTNPDSVYYSVEISVSDNKLVLTGVADKASNRNAAAEWVGSSEGQGMGMNISEKIGMHMLPLHIRLESANSPAPAINPATTIGAFDGPLPEVIVTRKVEIQRTIILDTGFIKLDLYDNGEIDGDIATIIVDGKIIIDRQLLTTKAASVSLHLSKERPEHLLQLFANNLGTIPPNTALVVLTCNNKRYEITLSSNGTVNGSVKLIIKSN